MAGMGNEVGDVAPLGHHAGIRRRRIQTDHDRSSFQFRDNVVRDFANEPVRDAQNHRLRPAQRLFYRCRLDSGLSHLFTSLFARLNVVDFMLWQVLEVGGDPTTHLSSGAQESNFHVDYTLMLCFVKIGH
jgi:hypothetical protein